jgi:exonuclease III
MSLHLLTYNIFGMPWGCKNIESVLLWCFYKTDAEILCFQEVFSEEHKQKIMDICSKQESSWNCWFPSVDPTCLSRITSFFELPSGLCILTKKSIKIIGDPYFEEFQDSKSLDRFVRKGFFHLSCSKENHYFDIITLHFQSDFTECQLRIRYQDIRIQQELQLFRYVKDLKNAIVVGDFNTQRLYHFQFVNSNRQSTFPQTGESLDHCLVLPNSPVSCSTCKYFHAVHFSDHTPVLFHLKLLES